MDLKGIAGPARAWAALRASSVESRFDAVHMTSLTAPVGREYYREALALVGELGMRPLVAHCHLGLGKLSRRTPRRAQAQEHLATAMRMYRDMDMWFWLEQVETELGRPGMRRFNGEARAGAARSFPWLWPPRRMIAAMVPPPSGPAIGLAHGGGSTVALSPSVMTAHPSWCQGGVEAWKSRAVDDYLSRIGLGGR
jgi:hypothetical protein